MKRLVEETDVVGLDSLLNERVLLLCANYFYEGILTGVNEKFVELSEPHIVYQTGDWSTKTYEDRQKLPAKVWFIQTAAIESFGRGK